MILGVQAGVPAVGLSGSAADHSAQFGSSLVALSRQCSACHRGLLFTLDFEIRQNGRDNFETDLSFHVVTGRPRIL